MLEAGFRAADDVCNYRDYHTWLSFGICSSPTESCFFGSCKKCPGFDHLRAILQQFYDDNNIKTIKYNIWTNTDRSTLETKLDSADDFIENFISRLPKLLKHSFLTKQQNLYFNNLKDNLETDEILVILDFSENYSFTIQNEIQSYHWSNDQSTIHPFGIYLKKDNKLEFVSFIIISDISKHSTITVEIFIEFLQDLKKKTT